MTTYSSPSSSTRSSGTAIWRRLAKDPLRNTLFTIEQLAAHANMLALAHQIDARRGSDSLLQRLRENESALGAAYATIAEASAAGQRPPPAADWLLDNFYLVEEQIRTARRHLPRGYSRELPRLKDGNHAGFPRVYAIALELISHVDGRVDSESLARFVTAYQRHATLTLGELWAIPIMLRLALIENLRRVSIDVTLSLERRTAAIAWAERIIGVAEKTPTDLVLVLADLARANMTLSNSFVAGFIRRLQGQSVALGMASTWLEQRLADKNTTIEQVIQAENQEQAANQVSIGNSIGSLRSLSALDWRQFVESLSAVEQCLRTDPAGIYAQMDFATRDSYRHVVEELAKQGAASEHEVAQAAIALAHSAVAEDARTGHIGYYLVDHGRAELEQRLVLRRSLLRWLRHVGRAAPLAWYAAAITALTVGASWTIIDALYPQLSCLWLSGFLIVLLALVTSQWALSLVNMLATAVVRPRALPRLDFSKGIPPECRTMVVVPTMLRSSSDIDNLLEGLEVRYLANPDSQLDFALLTDFPDASKAEMRGDAQLIERACDGIEGLNRKYSEQRANIFFLFHRPRRWNPKQGVWMGYERKRGKLAELNRLLIHGERERFSVIVGETSVFSRVRFIITLDTDTQLPRDAARQLVGTLAHPLNRAQLGPDGRLQHGYVILQPRAAISLPSASRSAFAAIYSGEPGIDPYSRAVSDVYQDLFGAGSFVGKGIYEIAPFERILHGRFPDDSILSHDLIEGCYAHAGLVSDITVFEEHPSRYLVDIARRHRWTRGDWQLIPWLRGTVSDQQGRRMPNTLSVLAQVKLLDNLRRSLVSPAILALLIAAWTIIPGHGAAWVLAVGVLLASPVVLNGLVALCRKPIDLPLIMHLRNQSDAFGGQSAQVVLSLIFLPFEAAIQCDAIIRTLMRLLITRRHLLEWQTASDTERTSGTSLVAVSRAMWVSPALAAVLGWYALAYAGLATQLACLPLATLWLFAPVAAWLLSRPARHAVHDLDDGQLRVLSRLSRATWRFFEQFVGPEDQWLPPDNYQEFPVSVVAHRTSPTNIGLSLLANLAAYDFGFIPIAKLLERSEKTLATMARMERHRGHLYNWYDTRTAKPLAPLYVSMVDSGNLAGHLLILRRGLLELFEAPLWLDQAYAGLASTFGCMQAAMDAREGKEQSEQVAKRLARIADLLATPAQGTESLASHLVALNNLVRAAADLVTAMTPNGDEEHLWWAGTFEHECRDHRDWLVSGAPWCLCPPPPPHLWQLSHSSGGSGHHHLEDLRRALAHLDEGASLNDVARFPEQLLPRIDAVLAEYGGEGTSPLAVSAMRWLSELRGPLVQASARARLVIERIERLAHQCQELAEMDFGFLYDRSRELFVIGFNVSEGRADRSYYDLLASEARLGSYVAIAQGQVSQDHWFALGRLLTSSHSSPALLSWSGSMFEYLMPLLIMPTYEHTLLDQTYKAVIRRQIEYGRQRGVPWGISESGYNITDAQLNYQYRAFGVPGLGLKRGLGDDLVIAPYATVMGLMVDPGEAYRNIERITQAYGQGHFGLFEAIDFTPARLPHNQSSVTVRSFMAHHQGMSLLALAYVLLDRPMQRRFSSDPLFKATELLLQERIPKTAAMVYPHAAEVGSLRKAAGELENVLRVVSNPTSSSPEVHLLSNGRYHVMVSGSGGGSSRWRDFAATRWREDAVRDSFGFFCYLRDVDLGEYWSTAFQPTLKAGKSYEAIFSQSRAEIRRLDHDLEAHTEIAVSPEDDAELRRTTLINRSRIARIIEVTSYAEVVLAPQAGELAHPAFSNLFVQTRIDRGDGSIICSRRPRRAAEQPPWLAHLMVLDGQEAGTPSFETDRARFIGRGRTASEPQAMLAVGPLSGTEGAVLDPIVSIRRTLVLQPDESAQVTLVLCLGDSREAVEVLKAKYRDKRLAERVFGLAWTHSQVVLAQLGASEADAQIYGRLAGSVVYPGQLRRAAPSVLLANHRGQSGLWAYGISGDLPIVLLKLADAEKMDIVAHLLRAHAYWRMKGLAVDLVIVNEDHSVYRQVVNDQILGLIAAGPGAALMDKPGGIFVRRSDQISDEDRILLQTVARAVIPDNGGTLAQFVERRGRPEMLVPRFAPIRQHRTEVFTQPALAKPDLLFGNGIGGFTRDGREYVMVLPANTATPAPWVNVLANPAFGTVVSESGGAYTWSENSHEFRLTPWCNDAVCDTSGEAFYLRDEETGRYWSPTPLPARGAPSHVVRHGFGYSVFECQEAGIASELITFVASEMPVKFIRITLRNASGRARRMSVTGYVEWVLGELRHKNAMHVVTEIDRRSGALVARNPYNTEFQGRLAFFAVDDPGRSATGDRVEFIGRNGTLAQPAALARARLSGRVGAGFDPCGALQAMVDLGDGERRELVFVLGLAGSQDELAQLIGRTLGPAHAQLELEKVWQFWKHTLGAVHVQTPDPAIDILANGWLLYQTMSCRLWARTGFYQSGGAYGFRDQIQDCMALMHASPQLTRSHLLRAAGRQFSEGDVQHWWHPPLDRGVRTHISDDFLWLPYAVCRYVEVSGDAAVLDEVVGFIAGRAVRSDEEGYYDLPQVADERGTLYEHCVRALIHGLRFGAHGLPLMGCGDWNDGMNLVGHEGRGESVWLAFFLHDALARFSQLATRHGDEPFARRCLDQAATLAQAIASHGWDGAWYRRAYFDDGSPLGSSVNPECQIDSLPQSWAVLTGVGDSRRAHQGLAAVGRRLVRRAAGLIQLFDPPFDTSALDPGYIKGYLPGVRENGGQYTHAAVWTIMAFAERGDTETAWDLMRLINPLLKSDSAEKMRTYAVEPYVVAADVYACPPHSGRGGWTWYTGSAGWMYRLLVESLLGVIREGQRLRIRARLPAAWPVCTIHYRFLETVYHITITRDAAAGKPGCTLDGALLGDGWIPLRDDRLEHQVVVLLPPIPPSDASGVQVGADGATL